MPTGCWKTPAIWRRISWSVANACPRARGLPKDCSANVISFTRGRGRTGPASPPHQEISNHIMPAAPDRYNLSDPFNLKPNDF